MLQRGRKSTANVSAPNLTGKRPRLTPPSSLNTAERTLFNELVGSCPPDQFLEKSDAPLLIAYVQAAVISQATAHDPDKIAIWEKSTRMLATLATRLRLAPQARVDPKTLARKQTDTGLRFHGKALTTGRSGSAALRIIQADQGRHEPASSGKSTGGESIHGS